MFNSAVREGGGGAYGPCVYLAYWDDEGKQGCSPKLWTNNNYQMR